MLQKINMMSKKTASLVTSACIDLPVYINLSNKCKGYRLPPVAQFLAGIFFSLHHYQN
jgi:hypothetical protein